MIILYPTTSSSFMSPSVVASAADPLILRLNNYVKCKESANNLNNSLPSLITAVKIIVMFYIECFNIYKYTLSEQKEKKKTIDLKPAFLYLCLLNWGTCSPSRL